MRYRVIDSRAGIVGYEVAHLGGSNLSTSWVHTFNPTTINEFSFRFLTDPRDYEKGDTTNYAQQFGLSQFLPSNAYAGLPHFQIGSVNLGSGDYRPLTVGEHNYQWTDNLTMIRGSHSIRIGADIRQTGLTTQNAEVSTGRFYFNGAETRNPLTNSTATGDAMADFLLGDMSQFGVGTPIQPVHKSFSTWAGYVNDTWHVRQNLTLTLGFRYELTTRWHADPPQYARPVIRNGDFADLIAVADPGGKLSPQVLPQALTATPGVIVGCTTVGLPSNCLVIDKKDWQPRLGVAYQLTSSTVIRAGGGIFYDYFYGDLDTEDGERYPFEIFNQTQAYTKAPTNGVPPLSISNPPVGGIGTPVLFASAPNRRVPGSYQWNFTVEQKLFSDIIMWNDQDTSDYQSLQTKLERRLSGGLSFIASYTFAKNLGFINGLRDPRFPQLDTSMPISASRRLSP